MTTTDIVVASAKRTAVGLFNGVFTTLPAHELGAVAISAGLQAAGVTALRINQLCGSNCDRWRSAQQIVNGDASFVVAGGQDSMSPAPHATYLVVA